MDPDDSRSMPLPRFHPGDLVIVDQDPAKRGVVEKSTWNPPVGSYEVTVEIEGRRFRRPERVLTPYVRSKDKWDSFRIAQFLGPEELLRRFTAIRLTQNQSRIAASYSTSRTVFYPHQFKPLLKFLDNPLRRLLIADDVGLGKTIEAGYILRELQAHENLARVLILVPSRLCPKWQQEMSRRFGQVFSSVDSKQFLSHHERQSRGVESGHLKWIGSYEGLGTRRVFEALSANEFHFDLIIADEAHRMRNADTFRFRVGDKLCETADSVVFLSATPIQNREEDLYSLLRLLDKEGIGRRWMFQSLMEQSRKAVALATASRASDVTWREVRARVYELMNRESDLSEFDRELREIETLFGNRNVNERPTLPERRLIQRYADRKNPIGHLVTRTRKRDAIPNAPPRSASWKPVRLSAEEQELQTRVMDACRQTEWHSGQTFGASMGSLMRYRMAASSMHAHLDYFRDSVGVSLADYEGDVSEFMLPAERAPGGVDDSRTAGIERDPIAATLTPKLYVNGAAFGIVDSKWEEFRRAIQEIWEGDDRGQRPRRKVVVFSYFRRTVEYLASKLLSVGVTNVAIHGGMPVEEREQQIDSFLAQGSGVAILITSDVGGEGIDLQQASVIVNYDLPWNPMVVEQRIGRLDRIGQDADKITIVNLVLEDSIEHRIVKRLLEKIGVFETCIGEIDPIIGEQVVSLTADFLHGRLSESELADREHKCELAFREIRTNAIETLEEATTLLSSDQHLVDEIEAVVREHQLPTERDLVAFVNEELAGTHPGCQIPDCIATTRSSIGPWPQVASSLRAMSSSPSAREIDEFARRLEIRRLEITASREFAYHHPHVDLLHFGHPLAKLAVESFLVRRGRSDDYAFAVQVTSHGPFGPGMFVFQCDSLKIGGLRPRTELVAGFTPLVSSNAGKIEGSLTGQQEFMRHIMLHGQPWRAPKINEEVLALARGKVEAEVERLRDQVERVAEDNERAWLARRFRNALQQADFQVDRLRRQLGPVPAGQDDSPFRKGLRTRLANAESRRDKLKAAGPMEASVSPEWATEFVGIVNVVGGL